MNFITLASLFAPEWLSIWFAVVAAGLFSLGFRRAAMILAIWPVVDWVVVPLLQPAIDELPLSWLLVILVLVAIATIRAVLELVIGHEGSGHVTGTYIVRLLDFILLAPFRTVRGVANLFLNR